MEPQDNLYSKTAIELVFIHNQLCSPKAKIEGQWKASKRSLIAMIRKLGPIPRNTTLPNPAENQKQEPVKTISNLIKEMLQTGISHEAIASAARAKFPNAKTTARSVASMACVIKKEKNLRSNSK